MPEYKYRRKDKLIKIFTEKQYDYGIVRKYIHPKDTFIHAYVRQLSISEQTSSDASLDGSVIEFVINKRNISQDMVVEFKGKFYKISPTDEYEFYNLEVKFRASEVIPLKPNTIEYEEWNK